MTRRLVSHQVGGANEALIIDVVDQPGQGNACHCYTISNGDILAIAADAPPLAIIEFQNGPIKECGVNGITNEALLAIVEDRLLGFQSGPFASRDNACALTHIQEAMMWLQKRTVDRLRRGVEGTNQQ